MDIAVVASAAKNNPASWISKAGSTAMNLAAKRAANRAETPAETASKLGVANAVKPLAKRLQAQQKLEFISKEEDSRLVLKQVEQQLRVTEQLS